MKNNVLCMLVLSLLLTACGGGEEEKPAGGIADIGSGSAQQGTEIAADPNQDPELPSFGPKVEIQGDTVVSMDDDGMGTKHKTEYRYQDGSLNEMTITFEYPDKATAESVFAAMENGELKQTADASYSEFHQDGNQVICTMNEEMVAVFTGMDQEELAAFLAGEPTDTNPFNKAPGGGAETGETTINTSWDAISAPEGFPVLAEGVTNYYKIDESNFSMDWDFLSAAEAEEIAAKLEEWSGTKAEVNSDENGANWTITADTCSVTLTYYVDTFDGAMPQVTLGVGIWQ